jgi:hypothetical protein
MSIGFNVKIFLVGDPLFMLSHDHWLQDFI